MSSYICSRKEGSSACNDPYTCEACKTSKYVIADRDQGEIVCTRCGLVVSTDVLEDDGDSTFQDSDKGFSKEKQDLERRTDRVPDDPSGLATVAGRGGKQEQVNAMLQELLGQEPRPARGKGSGRFNPVRLNRLTSQTETPKQRQHLTHIKRASRFLDRFAVKRVCVFGEKNEYCVSGYQPDHAARQSIIELAVHTFEVQHEEKQAEGQQVKKKKKKDKAAVRKFEAIVTACAWTLSQEHTGRPAPMLYSHERKKEEPLTRLQLARQMNDVKDEDVQEAETLVKEVRGSRKPATTEAGETKWEEDTDKPSSLYGLALMALSRVVSSSEPSLEKLLQTLVDKANKRGVVAPGSDQKGPLAGALVLLLLRSRDRDCVSDQTKFTATLKALAEVITCTTAKAIFELHSFLVSKHANFLLTPLELARSKSLKSAFLSGL